MAENTIIHEISLVGYKAASTGGMLDLGTWGSYGIEKLHLTLDAAWQDLTITAFFNVNGKVVAKRVVGKDGYADVPWEATKENTFAGCLAFEGSINGQRRISTNLNYKVTNHSETTDSDPVPTDDRWNQFVTETKGYRDGAFEAAEKANARAEDAETASEDAQAAARAAKASENAAAASASNAAADAAKAGPYAEAARAAQEAAESARDKAIAAQQAAENAAAAAADSKSAADTLAAEAARAALAAENSKAAANNAANLAGENATAAQQAAATATAAANDAGQSASDAAASKAAAETAAKAAQDAQTATAAAKAEAVKAQEAAQTAAKSAQDAQAASENVRDDAQTAQQGAEAARDAAAKSAEAAAKSEANVKQSADTLAESVKNITPDDSSIGDKPWSSKHIIDMLCPPLEESGNPVVCYPVAGYPLGVKAKWEPVQEGSGTPYPAGGGKNLWGDLIQNTFLSQLGISSGYSSAKMTGKIPCTEGDKYTLSCATSFAAAPGNIGVLAYFDASDTILTRSANTYQRAFTLTAPANAAYLRASCYKETDADNVQLEKGSTATDYAPYENIRPIKGRDSVTVERCGANLSKISDISTPNKSLIPVELPTEIVTDIEISFDTLNAEIKNVGTAFFLNKADGKWKAITVQDFGISTAGKIPNGRKTAVFHGVTFKTVETVIIKNGYCQWSGDVNNFCVSIIQNAPYTPYIGQTNTLTLPETVYGGEVDAVRGNGQETWKTLTLDGTENWTFQTTISPGKTGFVFQVPEIATPENPSIKGDIVCSQYPTITANDTYTCKNGISVESGNNHYFRIYSDIYAEGTTDEWKSYLAAQHEAGTPVQVCYKLAEPVPFTATGAQPMPALAGVNTVLTDADSATVTGRADPIKRIEDLEAAVASIN